MRVVRDRLRHSTGLVGGWPAPPEVVRLRVRIKVQGFRIRVLGLGFTTSPAGRCALRSSTAGARRWGGTRRGGGS